MLRKYNKFKLIKSLSKINTNNIPLIDKLKILYRPIICPYDDILEIIEGNENFLDIGCGNGQFLYLINEFLKPSFISGIEISDKLVKQANEILSNNENIFPKIDIIKYNGEEIPPQIKNVDVITCIDVIHHIPKQKQIDYINNLFKSIPENTILIIKDIEGKSILKYFNRLHDLILSKTKGYEMKSSVIIEILKQQGFKIVDYYHRTMLLYPHFIIVALK